MNIDINKSNFWFFFRKAKSIYLKQKYTLESKVRANSELVELFKLF